MLTYSDYVKVGIADYKISVNPNGLLTLGLGSCVGICLYDVKTRIGGMAHIMLPDSTEFKVLKGSENKYADIAIPNMVKEMESMGCRRSNFRAVIVGGGNMFINSPIPQEQGVGYRNQLSVKNILSSLSIPVVAQDLGGNIGKTVYFHLECGDVYVKKGLDVELLYKGF